MSRASEVSKEEFQEWLLNPVTKALKERFELDRERLKESWANGEYNGNPTLEAEVRGQCQVLAQFLALELDDIAKD